MPERIIIVAHSDNRVIGRDNAMPWHLPRDLRYFKSQTQGHPVIMGRKTYQSLGRALPQRENIVISRQALDLPDAHLAASLQEALALTLLTLIQSTDHPPCQPHRTSLKVLLT